MSTGPKNVPGRKRRDAHQTEEEEEGKKTILYISHAMQTYHVLEINGNWTKMTNRREVEKKECKQQQHHTHMNEKPKEEFVYCERERERSNNVDQYF